MLKRYTGGEWVEQGGGGGTNDYADLNNKPKINNTTLSGNKTSSDLGLQPAINGSAKVNADYIDDSTSTNKFVTAADKTNWNAKLGPGDTYTKQELDDEFTAIDNAIDAVEAGAAAGATALQPEDVASTYNSSGTAPINGTGVAAALSTLDVPAVGGSGKYLSQISEVDGKVEAIPQTMDSIPTEDSYKAISSDGVWADQQRQDALEAEDRAALIGQVDSGAKNLLKFDAIGLTIYGTIYESNGVKFTLNADNTVTFERISASSSAANCLLILNGAILDISSYCDGNHILSGCPSGGGGSSYEIMATVSGGAYTKRDYGTGVTLDSVSGISPYVQLTVRSGFTGTATYKPMICTATDYTVSPTFQPYALPNPTLTPAAIKAVDEGDKNKFAYGDLIGITTNFSDQTFSLHAGSYKLIFTASASTGSFAVRLKDAQNNSIYYITSDNVATTRTYDLNISEDAAKITFYSSVSNDFTNIMICTAADWAVSQKFVPYCPTNRELYETKVTINNVYGFGTTIPSNSDLNNYKTPGVYRVESSTVAATILNLPTGAAAGRLEVKGLHAADRYLQIYYSGDVIFQRRWGGSSWYTWYKFEGTAVT